MPKVIEVGKARKDQADCGRCGAAIPAGSPYRWTQRRFGPRMVRCMKPECHFRGSELTSSDKLSRLYQAQESLTEALAGSWELEDMASMLRDASEEVRSVSEEYEESASNMEEHFSGSEQIDEIREKAEAAEAFADALEEAADSIEAIEQRCSECEENEEDGPHEVQAGKDDYHEFQADEEAVREEARSHLEEATDSLSV